MSGRSQERRVAQSATHELSPDPDSSTSRTRGRGRKVKVESDIQDDAIVAAQNEIHESVQEPVAGPSRGGRRRGRGRVRGRERPEEDGETDDTEGVEEKATRRRSRKAMSYREVPVEVEEEQEEDDLGDEDGEDVIEVEGEAQLPVSAYSADEPQDDSGRPVLSRSVSASAPTPGRRARSAMPAFNSDEDDKSYGRPNLEKVGSGRGGFSVKGAASAAARARWDRVRKEKAERGDESDEGDRVKRIRMPGKKDSRAAAESFDIGSVITIKHTEYKIGDDEVILPDDDKGAAKVDEQGRLLGCREYKLVTFTSETRRNPDRVYALTIDAARACGYADSLAFLRRCPQVLKLGCNAEERQMLIDIGRVTGNLKHRMVTMVAMRNVYKLMGARLVKNGKWVTDDYYEDEALSRCAENGFTPYTVAHEDGIIANAMSSMQPQGRPAQQTSTDQAQRPAVTLAPFYSLGGPTTHFAGSGADPWSEAGWGHKRSRLRNQGVSEGDWMFRIAEECRRVDAMLREYREERLKVLDKVDASKGWVYAVEQGTEKAVEEDDGWLRPVTPTLERKWSGLSQEVTFPGAVDHEAAQAPGDGDVSMEADADVVVVEEDQAGKIVGQTPGEEEEGSSRWRWGIGGEWKPGIIRAAYEPHTQMPHIPIHTQPQGAAHKRLSPYPILSSIPDAQHKNFVQSTITGRAARGLASVEYVFEPPRPSPSSLHLWDEMRDSYADRAEERKRRMREVEAAEEWEREARRRRGAA